MASELATAYVKIIPSAEGIQGKITEALGGEAADAGKKAGSGFASSFGSGLKTAGVVAGAVATATAALTGAMVKGASETAAYGDNIDKMSQKMGLSAQAYQEWDAIMQHSGTSITSLQSGMKTLANAVENGNGAFERLGITQDMIAGMDNEQLFSATITALQNVDNETERTYLAGQLLGRGATELGALLNTSAEETEAMRQRVHELGGVLSDEAVSAAAAFQDNLQDMQTAFSGLSNNLLAEFLPSLTTVMGGLTEIFSGNSDKGLGMVSEGISAFVENIAGATPQIIEVGGGVVLALVQAITDNLPKLIDSGMDAVLTIAEGIIGQLPDIIQSGLEVISSLANGIAESLPELIPTVISVVTQIVETLIDNVDMLIDSAIAIIVALADGLIQNLPTLIEKAPEIVLELVGAIIRNAPKLLDAAMALITSLAQGIANSFSLLVKKGSEIVDTVKNGFLQKVSNAKNWGSDLIQNFISGITAKWESLKSTVSNVAQTVKDYLGFSEPKKGPLSDFHTYAPDMIDLFASGIRQGIGTVESAVNSLASAAVLDVSAQPYDAGVYDTMRTASRSAGYTPAAGAQSAVGDGSILSAIYQLIEIVQNKDLTVEVDGQTVSKIVTKYQRQNARAMGI